jgi:acetoin utilization deacetylase AcuC-like enzyme
MGVFHVESPKRIASILDMIEDEISFPYLKISPRLATEEEILWNHSETHLDTIKNSAGKERVVLDPDTSTSALSYETALLAVGGLFQSLDLIFESEINNAFAPVRPPGHHAESGQAMGFCLFNNIALAAEYLLRKKGQKKLLIIDWDLHHGNGTQNSFYHRNDVLYFSTHQFPHYPGTGHWSETGNGDGQGFTVNIPLYPGKNDSDFLFIFQNILGPITAQFEPDTILVSAGFDVADSDPLGGMGITATGFGAMTAETKELAQKHCRDRLLIALEGGYDLQALREGSKQVILQLAGSERKPAISSSPSPRLERELEPVFKHLRSFWEL